MDGDGVSCNLVLTFIAPSAVMDKRTMEADDCGSSFVPFPRLWFAFDSEQLRFLPLLPTWMFDPSSVLVGNSGVLGHSTRSLLEGSMRTASEVDNIGFVSFEGFAMESSKPLVGITRNVELEGLVIGSSCFSSSMAVSVSTRSVSVRCKGVLRRCGTSSCGSRGLERRRSFCLRFWNQICV